jgi:hypothetical protein
VSRRFLVPLPVALLLSLVLGGCEESNDEQEIILPPLAVNSTIPDEFVTFGTGAQDLTVIFERSAAPSSLEAWLYPLPASAGAFEPNDPASRRQWTWSDVELDPAAIGYHLLIDGFEMAIPHSVSFDVDDEQIFEIGIAGQVTSGDRRTVDPEGTVVFALVRDTVFNPSQPETWADAQGDIASAVVVVDDTPLVDEPERYRLWYLEPERRYFVVAIKDTNDDLRYDPTTDWWDAFEADGEFEDVPARPLGGTDDGDGEIPADLVIRPPGGQR